MLLTATKLREAFNGCKDFPELMAIKEKLDKRRGCKSCLPNEIKQELYALLMKNQQMKEAFKKLFSTDTIHIYYSVDGKKDIYAIR